MNSEFEFIFPEKKTIAAESIEEAIAIFKEEHPDRCLLDIYRIQLNGKQLACQDSENTDESIYYLPGCPYNLTNCILDPMWDIARSCDHQSDMTPDKWVACGVKKDDDRGWRPHYDSECK